MVTRDEDFLNTVTARFQNRDIYLWGARQDGLSMCRVLERLGYRPKGFIDSSVSMEGKELIGYRVHAPGDILKKRNPTPYVIITSSFYTDEIADSCRQAGLTSPDDFIAGADIQQFDYQIDVAGACNLRCISCPRGNYQPQPRAGWMTTDTYGKVLSKILLEDPFVGSVYLYNWGEPLLNPYLAEIVDLTNKMGVHAALSSNLNIRKDFADVIKAKPTWFRISASGFGPNYEITHTGGSWDLFLKNVYRLKELQDEYHPGLQVELFYHIYRHNNGDDFAHMRDLCDQLGFTFRFRHAALAPLENIEAFIDGRPMSAQAKRTMELQALPVAEAMAIARQQKDRPCFYQRCLWITWDLKISQCMEWFNPDLQLVPGDFLSTPLQEIAAARQNSEFCRRCREKAIHRCYIVYGDEKLVHERRSVNL
ncbi:MAG: radical SAM protein [Deltaproteobacteria bacterium]|nr:radical SAM protein [Deltaproteobacteria bacterium]